ncbi:MAG: hypothetical protein JWN46_1608 [Acidimicrobiales bacterium]|nr:hypothetical protein [Acidimicrobiales bacterium]
MARRTRHLIAAGTVVLTAACGASGPKVADTTTTTAAPTTTAPATTSTSTSTTSTSTTGAPTSTSTPSTSTGRLDAGVFSVTSRFTGASKWTKIAEDKPKPGAGGLSAEGTIRIMGPGTGHGRADIVVHGPVASLGGLTLSEVGAKAIAAGRYTVTGGPTTTMLGGEPALAYAADQDTNKVALIITLHNGGTFVASLTASPDIFSTVTPAFRYVFESFKFA